MIKLWLVNVRLRDQRPHELSDVALLEKTLHSNFPCLVVLLVPEMSCLSRPGNLERGPRIGCSVEDRKSFSVIIGKRQNR